jgi:hypothetical protein
MKIILIFLTSFNILLCKGNSSMDDSAPAPPIGGFNVYMGHIHNHTTVSNAHGTPDRAYTYARDIAGLDFLGITDHAESIDSSEWNNLTAIADAFNSDNIFVALRGFEWSSSAKYGHVSILDTSEYCTSVNTATDTFNELCIWISARNGIAFFNHPGRENSMGTEFNHFTTSPVTQFVGMELWNKNDGFNVYYYNDGYNNGDNGLGYFDEALQNGWHTGASGSGDDHWGTWGTAQTYRMAVLANAKTRSEILGALRARRFYSTLDRNLSLSFKIDGNEMGSTISAGISTFKIMAEDGSGRELFTNIFLLKNGKIINEWSPNQKKVIISIGITTSAGEYYYVRVRQDDGDEAISSPIWIQ